MTESNKNTVPEEDAQHGRYLIFKIMGENYGIEISFVMEIIGVQPVIGIPETPAYVKGIINLRGKIIPVIDMRIRLHKDAVEYTDRTCIIVININNIYTGLIVDSVSEVISISDENITSPANLGSSIQDRYIKGIGKAENNVILLLDCQKLLSEDIIGISDKAINS